MKTSQKENCCIYVITEQKNENEPKTLDKIFGFPPTIKHLLKV